MIHEIRPLRGYVILRLDPQPKKTGNFYHPDEDYIDCCERCGMMMEELAQPCVPQFEFGWNKTETAPVLTAVHRGHKIVRETQPIMPNATQPATIFRSASPPWKSVV